jgi:ribosomal protein S20
MTTVKEFEALQKKHKVLEKRKIENETGIKTILRRLKDEFDTNSVEEAETLIQQLEDKIEMDEKRFDDVVGKIKKAVDWEMFDEN